jgi:Fe-S cluster biogenesis protein NfuA
MARNNNATESALYKEVHEVMELIRPSIQADGGDVELVSVNTKGVVSIRFLGACIGCPSLDMTLQSTIETTLRSRIEAVTSIEAVE